eukprot:GHVS01029226.1.p1 GENE.GHVS01029226.1~~GHVS01029226.1.p1  ORF type:complete len:156 (+),score=20.38 GHVS01029226.1:292-759(+)
MSVASLTCGAARRDKRWVHSGISLCRGIDALGGIEGAQKLLKRRSLCWNHRMLLQLPEQFQQHPKTQNVGLQVKLTSFKRRICLTHRVAYGLHMGCAHANPYAKKNATTAIWTFSCPYVGGGGGGLDRMVDVDRMVALDRRVALDRMEAHEHHYC